MPIYTARMDTALAINTTIELNLQVTGQNVSLNQTNFKYTLKIKKNNNYNDNFKGNASIWLNVGKNQILDGATSSWTIHGADHGNAASTSYTLKTGTFSVTHNSDGTKTANVSVLVDPNVSNAGGSWGTREQMRIEQSMVLTKINRNVSFTMSPSSTITLGNTLTVNVSGIASSNYHQAYLYVDGKSHLIGTRSGNGSISGRIPSDLVTSATAKTLSGSVRVFSYTSLSNLTSIGSPTKAINVYIPANAPVPPTVTGSTITGTGLNSGFMGANQHVSGKSVLKATVQGASAQSGSSINLYEVRVVLSGTNTTIMSGTSTTSTVSLGTVPQVTPAAGQVADVITRVRDNRGIWSSEKKQSSALRLHRYSTPSGSGTTKRSGTSAIVNISWSVTSVKEGGKTERNSAKIYIDTKTRSSSSWSNKYANTSASLSGTYKATLTGYSTTTSYDVRLRVVDALGTTTVNLNSLGTESVPLDVTQRGIGVGKIHSGSGANLQVGAGGIDSEGSIKVNGKATQAFRITTDSGSSLSTASNLNNQITGLEGITPTTANSPVGYGTVLGLGGFEILIGSDNSARFRRWSGAPSTAGPWLNAMDKDGTILPKNYNLNSAVETGYYYVDSNASAGTFTNAPSGILAGFLEVFKSGSMIYQKWTNYGAASHANKVFIRGRNESKYWSAWERLAFASDIPSIPSIPNPFTKGSNTNGKWIRFSDGTIIAERKVTVTYTHGQKIPNYAYNMPVSMPTDSYVGVSLRSAYTANSEAEIDIYDNFDFLVVGKRGNQWIMKPNLFNRYGSVSYGANNGNWFNTKAGTSYTMHLTFTAIGVV